MIKNDSGLVAVRHWNSNPAAVEIGGFIYQFVPKYNVSLGWVHEQDLHTILMIRANVCCGATKEKFRLANQNDVNIHNTGHV